AGIDKTYAFVGEEGRRVVLKQQRAGRKVLERLVISRLPGEGRGAGAPDELHADRLAIETQRMDRRTTLLGERHDRAAHECRVGLVAQQRRSLSAFPSR